VIQLCAVEQYVDLYDLRFLQRWLWRMPSSVMWRHVAFVRTEVSEDRIASIIRVKRISELGVKLAATSNWSTQQRSDSCHPDNGGNTFVRNVGSYKTRTVPHPEDGILHYIELLPVSVWTIYCNILRAFGLRHHVTSRKVGVSIPV
jgi:hypothetical protein